MTAIVTHVCVYIYIYDYVFIDNSIIDIVFILSVHELSAYSCRMQKWMK